MTMLCKVQRQGTGHLYYLSPWSSVLFLFKCLNPIPFLLFLNVKKIYQNLCLKKLKNSAALKIVFLLPMDSVVIMTVPYSDSMNDQLHNLGMK